LVNELTNLLGNQIDSNYLKNLLIQYRKGFSFEDKFVIIEGFSYSKNDSWREKIKKFKELDYLGFYHPSQAEIFFKDLIFEMHEYFVDGNLDYAHLKKGESDIFLEMKLYKISLLGKENDNFFNELMGKINLSLAKPDYNNFINDHHRYYKDKFSE